MSIVLVMPSSHLIFWHPLLLPSIFHSIRDFSNKSAVHIRWPKSWSFNFSISPSEYLGLISHKIDWFDLLAVLGNQESSPAPSFEGINSDIQPSLWSSSQWYMITGKTIASTIWKFVHRVMSLLFNTLSRFVIAFLPRTKHLLISWLQSPSVMILEPKKRKFVTISTFTPLYLPWSNGVGWHDLSFSNV